MSGVKLIDGTFYKPLPLRTMIKNHIIEKGAITLDDVTNFVRPLHYEKIDVRVELTEEDKDQGCISKIYNVYKYTNESLHYILKDLIESGEIIELAYSKPGIQYRRQCVYFGPDSHFVFTKPVIG